MQFLFIAILLVQIATIQASSRQKRLVLHADTDIIQEIVKLRAEMAALNNTYKNDIENLKTSHKAEMATFVSQVTNTLNEHGSTYIRWGRKSCGGRNGTQLIYKGYMAGSNHAETGNGANQQCLPEDPTWAKFDDGNQSGDRAYMYGTEYDEYNDVIFGKHVQDEDVPCAVCHVPGTSLMIPARTTCYPGWTLEYTGYLMSSYHARSRPSDYVCVDGDPEFVIRGSADTNGHLLYLVEGICGTLACPPYFNYRELACSVCSKI